MGQEIKMQGGASGVYRPEGSHTPHMVPTKPEVVKTAEGQKELWPDNPFWFGIEIETRKKRTKYESENQKMLVNVGTGVKEGLAEISQVYEVDSEAFVKVFTGLCMSSLTRRRMPKGCLKWCSGRSDRTRKRTSSISTRKRQTGTTRPTDRQDTAPPLSTVRLMNSSPKVSSHAAPCPICSG